MRRAICSRRDTCATSALLHKKICIQCTILSLSQKKLCTFIFFHTTSPAIVAQYTDILHRPDLLFTRLSRSDVPQCQTLPWRISTLELGYCFSQTSHTWVRVLEEKSYLDSSSLRKVVPQKSVRIFCCTQIYFLAIIIKRI